MKWILMNQANESLLGYNITVIFQYDNIEPSMYVQFCIFLVVYFLLGFLIPLPISCGSILRTAAYFVLANDLIVKCGPGFIVWASKIGTDALKDLRGDMDKYKKVLK